MACGASTPARSAYDVGGLRVQQLTGSELAAALDDVASLRVSVFRAWPYLYEGSLDYERKYIAEFAKAETGVIIAARDGARVVGIATASPLTAHTQAHASLFTAHGIDPERVFYCGESVLLPAYRGRGIGHAFFDLREAHARKLSTENGPFTHAAFCGVVRDANDPRRPPDYVPLDAFWRKRGFERAEGLVGNYAWKEVGATTETRHPMQFWLKAL